MDLITPDKAEINNVGNLITRFGYVEYTSGENTSTQKIIKQLDTAHQDGNYYFELKNDILDSDSVSLVIKARNYNYRFKLK